MSNQQLQENSNRGHTKIRQAILQFYVNNLNETEVSSHIESIHIPPPPDPIFVDRNMTRDDEIKGVFFWQSTVNSAYPGRFDRIGGPKKHSELRQS